MTAEKLKESIQDLVELPTLPSVVAELIGQIESPDSTAADIERILVNDPALGAKVLKLVNSAFYGMTKKVGSIRQAIVILGFSTIRSLAISASVIDIFKDRKSKHLHMKDFWTHSIGNAAAARMIALEAREPDAELYFVCGLLHDIGKLALSIIAERQFNKTLKLAERKGLAFYDAEAFVFTRPVHEDAAFWLCESWQLPERIIMASGNHHKVISNPELGKHAAAVALANYLCASNKMGHSGNFCDPVFPENAQGCFPGLDFDRVSEMFSSEIDKTSGISEVLA